jgi:hypothetical protein
MKPHGEYVCVAFYLILKYFVDSLIMVMYDQNM